MQNSFNQHFMKKLFLSCFIASCSFYVHAENTDTTANTEKQIRNKILGDIQETFERKNKTTDSTIARLDYKLSNLDSLLKSSNNGKEKVDKIVERVKLLEDKQKAIEQNELNVYQANYQSAVINLASMDREIKPLVLFHSTRDFFESLSETADPSTYPGYKEWFSGFKKYIEKNKRKDATLGALSNILELSGNIAQATPLSGTVSELLCTGMASYVNTIKRKNSEARKEAQRMFTLTMTLCQFTHDKDAIEHEWDEITKELCDLQVYYDTSLNRNLNMVSCSANDFNYQFVTNKDANRRYIYLSCLRQKAADLVTNYKSDYPKEWKDNIYYQLTDVQALKSKYGEITYHISEHINKYDMLVKKYKSDKEIGPRVMVLKTKLDDLKNTFDNTYEPKDYRNTIVRMYKVM